MARPTKLTIELKEKIVDLVQRGNYIATACIACGISRQTYYRWRLRGKSELKRVDKNPRCRIRKKEKPYVDFLEDTEKADAEAEVLFLEKIRQGEQGWQSAGWYLERRHFDKWGRKEKREITGASGGPVVVKTIKGLNLKNVGILDSPVS